MAIHETDPKTETLADLLAHRAEIEEQMKPLIEETDKIDELLKAEIDRLIEADQPVHLSGTANFYLDECGEIRSFVDHEENFTTFQIPSGEYYLVSRDDSTVLIGAITDVFPWKIKGVFVKVSNIVLSQDN